MVRGACFGRSSSYFRSAGALAVVSAARRFARCSNASSRLCGRATRASVARSLLVLRGADLGAGARWRRSQLRALGGLVHSSSERLCVADRALVAAHGGRRHRHGLLFLARTGSGRFCHCPLRESAWQLELSAPAVAGRSERCSSAGAGPQCPRRVGNGDRRGLPSRAVDALEPAQCLRTLARCRDREDDRRGGDGTQPDPPGPPARGSPERRHLGGYLQRASAERRPGCGREARG